MGQNMKYMKNIIIAFCICGLLLTGSAFAGLAFDQNDTQVEPSIRFLETSVPDARSSMRSDVSSLLMDPVHKLSGSTDADVQVTFADGFDMQPTVATDNAGNMVLGYLGDPQGMGEYNVWFTSSVDQGATWLNENSISLAVAPPEKPSIDYWGDNRFVGTYVPNPNEYDGSALYVIQFNNPGLLEDGFDAVYWTWNDVGDGYMHIQDVSIGCDNAVEDYAWGGISMVGDIGEDLSSVPMFSYQATEDGTAWIYSFSDTENDILLEDCQGTSTDIDPVTHESYSLWNFVNTTTGLHDIYFSKFDFATWDEYEGYPIHPSLAEGIFSSGNDDLNVAVSANNDNVIIVAETQGDITCYYSNDGMGNISTSTIVASEDEESYPEITHTGDNQAVCSFVKNNNIYTVTTEDGGATWDTAVQINDEDGSVVADDSNTGICKLGAVWTDDRTGDYNVFFDTLGIAIPVISVESIAGGFGVSAEIVNTGTADATNVDWSIIFEGGFMLLGGETTGTIDTLAAGDSASISTGFILGIGGVDITVTAGSAKKTASATVILPFVIGLK